MEAYIERKKKDDGVINQYIRNVKSIYCYGSGDKKNLHVIDFDDEGIIVFDVIKIEVY